MASPKAPPYDTLLMSPGQMAVAVENDIIQKIDPASLSNWSKLDPAFQGEYGPTVTVEVNGIAYNPELVPRPAGYRDLFENPAFAGKVSWTGFGSNTAVMAYTQLAKIFGSGPDDMDAVFKLFKDHPENLAKGVVDSTNHQMTLYQQREIAVFMCSTGNVAKLRSLGLKAEFVHPQTGSPAAPVNIHLTKGSKSQDAAYAYMDAAISKAAQDQLKLPPTEMFPTNKDVELTPGIRLMSRATPPQPRLSGLGADQQATQGLDPRFRCAGSAVTRDERGRPPVSPDALAVGGVLCNAARASHRHIVCGATAGRRSNNYARFLGDPFNFRVLVNTAGWGSKRSPERPCSVSRSRCSTGTAARAYASSSSS